MPKVAEAVRNLSEAPLDDETFSAAELCKTKANKLLGIETRTTLFTSPLYFDFLTSRAMDLLDEAKRQTVMARRRELLTAAKLCKESAGETFRLPRRR